MPEDNTKTLLMRDKINNLLPLGDVRLSIGVLETAVRPDIYLDCFSSTDPLATK